jgi:hypothetical protein
MGKAGRNRKRRASEAEMAADTPDSTIDTPRLGGGLSPQGQEYVDRFTYAWLFLQCHLSVAADQILPAPPTAMRNTPSNPEEQQKARETEELLRTLQPHTALADRDTAAEVLTWIKPHWKTDVGRNILAVGQEWLDESEYAPDPAEWLTGASLWWRFMCPAHHHAQDQAMWDLDTIAERQHIDQHQDVPLISLDAPRGSAWWLHAENRVKADPVAFLHGCASLVTWLFVQPNACFEPRHKQLMLALRGKEFLQFGSREPG